MGGMLRWLAGRVAAVGGAEDAVADVGGLGRGLCQHRDQQHGEAMAEQAGRREAAGGQAEASGSGARAHAERRDRKSVVWGKSVSVRVELGGPRTLNIKKQERNNHYITTINSP